MSVEPAAYRDSSEYRLTDPESAQKAGVASEVIGAWRRPTCGVVTFNAWLERNLGEHWTAAYRLAIQDGAFVVSELRVFPSKSPRLGIGEWSGILTGINAGVPRGGLTATLAREASKISPALTDGRNVLADLARRALYPHEIVTDLKAKGLETLRAPDVPAREGSGRPGMPVSFYRRVARIYAGAVSRGKPPNKAVAAQLGLSDSRARDAVYRARRLGLLPPTARGRARA